MDAEDMPVQGKLLCSPVGAPLAGEGPLSRVRSHVHLEVRGHAEPFAALGAVELAVLGVFGQHVLSDEF